MKRTSVTTLFFMAFTMLFAINLNAQQFSELDKSPMDAAAFPASYKESNKKIKIVYSRPSLRGRSLEKLTPMGKVWRTGANEAAELTVYEPMVLGGTKIPVGTYTFYLIPGEEQWTAVVNRALNVWGSYFYDESQDVARLKVPVQVSKGSIENFSIAFDESENSIDMYVGWGNLLLTIPFQN